MRQKSRKFKGGKGVEGGRERQRENNVHRTERDREIDTEAERVIETISERER